MPRRSVSAPPSLGRSPRLRAVVSRLDAAEEGFERSMIALRKAALDHIDGQHVLGTVLRTSLDRLVLHGLDRP